MQHIMDAKSSCPHLTISCYNKPLHRPTDVNASSASSSFHMLHMSADVLYHICIQRMCISFLTQLTEILHNSKKYPVMMLF